MTCEKDEDFTPYCVGEEADKAQGRWLLLSSGDGTRGVREPAPLSTRVEVSVELRYDNSESSGDIVTELQV
jgi:hypothetical protein